MTTTSPTYVAALAAARELVRHRRSGYCACHVGSDACGYHRLTATEPYAIRYRAGIIAIDTERPSMRGSDLAHDWAHDIAETLLAEEEDA